MTTVINQQRTATAAIDATTAFQQRIQEIDLQITTAKEQLKYLRDFRLKVLRHHLFCYLLQEITKKTAEDELLRTYSIKFNVDTQEVLQSAFFLLHLPSDCALTQKQINDNRNLDDFTAAILHIESCPKCRGKLDYNSA
ncbi:MAG: hypothetical protein RIQ54_593 [Candidatus Parcubacteria bacterium]|jgi:hypothetical protein